MEKVKNVSEKEIKRGAEIKNGHEGLVYALTFLKDMVTLYYTYFSDWSSWLEDNSYKYEIVHTFLEHKDEDSEKLANEFDKIDFKEGLLQEIFNELIKAINDTILVVENNTSIEEYQHFLENISNRLQKICIIKRYFWERAWRDMDFQMDAMDFFDGVVTDSVFMGFEFIKNLVDSLKTVDNWWLETDAY